MIVDNTNIELVSKFVLDIAELSKTSSSLNLKFTTPHLFNFNFNATIEIEDINYDFNSVTQKYDLIIGDIPFGMERVQLSDTELVSVNRNWKIIYNALSLLNNNGKALFLVEPTIWYTSNGKRFLSALENYGVYLNAIFKTPERLLLPLTAFQPVVVIFSTIKKDELFIGEISDNNELLINNYFSNNSSDKLASGILLNKTEFESFNKYEIEMEIRSLKTQYKDYDRYQLGDVAININVTLDNHIEIENSLYIPKTFIDREESTRISTDLSLLTPQKHRSYFQVVLNNDLVNNEFLMLFYRSEIGRLILKSLSNRRDFISIRKQDLENSYVVVPKIIEQLLLLKTDRKLSELQETISQLKNELSLNPKNANIILDKFESIQAPLRQLSEEDMILSLIRKGENKTIEFKETFFKNTRTGQKDQEIQKASLKNIVGFLNSDGGNLLVGIADDGSIKGIEDDFFVSLDKYKLNFKNALHSKVGAEYYPLIDFELITIQGKLILKVECKPSHEPCFYDENEFYVRTNPATDRLEGRKQHEYIRERFSVKH